MPGKLRYFFDKAFLQNIITLVIGLVIGIPFGLWTNGLIQASAGVADRRNLTKAYTELLERLKAQVSIIPSLPASAMLEHDLEFSLFESTASMKYDLLDLALCVQLDELHSDLRQYQRKVHTLQRLVTEHPDAFTMMENGEVRTKDVGKQGEVLSCMYAYTSGSLSGQRGVLARRIEETQGLLRKMVE